MTSDIKAQGFKVPFLPKWKWDKTLFCSQSLDFYRKPLQRGNAALKSSSLMTESSLVLEIWLNYPTQWKCIIQTGDIARARSLLNWILPSWPIGHSLWDVLSAQMQGLLKHRSWNHCSSYLMPQILLYPSSFQGEFWAAFGFWGFFVYVLEWHVTLTSWTLGMIWKPIKKWPAAAFSQKSKTPWGLSVWTG